MLDTLAQGRLVVGLLRGTTNEAMTYDLNPAGGARAHRRGHGADPQGVDGAAAVRLAGPPLPVPAPSRSGRARCSSPIRRPTRWGRAASPASSPRATIWAAASPTGRSRSWARPRGTTASSARATAGSRRRSRSSTGRTCSWPRPTRRPRRCCAQQPNQAPFTMRAGRPRRRHDARLPQHRGRGAGADRGRRAADDVRRQPGHGRRAGPALSRRWSARACSTCPCTRRDPAISDPLMRALELFGTKVLPRIRDI